MPTPRDNVPPGDRASETPPHTHECTNAQKSETVRRNTIRIVNPLGLHHRIADLFSRTAKRFSSAIVVRNGERRADGKNILDLLMLIAMEGDSVNLEVSGSDADAAIGPLTEILAAESGEDYTI